MKTFSHLLKWELFEHRTFLLMALALGFLPYLLAPLISSVQADAGDARLILARVVALGFFLGAPLAFGTRWLMTALGNGRRAFELARPLSAWQLCGSKFVAILLLLVVGTLLVGAPTLFAAFDFDDYRLWALRYEYVNTFNSSAWQLYSGSGVEVWERPGGSFAGQPRNPPALRLLWGPAELGILLMAALSLMTFSQSMTFAVKNPRGRSLFDLLSWLVFFGLIGLALHRLGRFKVMASDWVLFILLAVAAFGLFSAWRSWKAGALLDEAHRRHSNTLNPGLCAIGTIAVIAAHVVTVPSPEKLVTFSLAMPSPDGSHWLVAGPQGRLEPAFLVHLEKRQVHYLEPAAVFFQLPNFAADSQSLEYWDLDRKPFRVTWKDGDLETVAEERKMEPWRLFPIVAEEGLDLSGGIHLRPEGLILDSEPPQSFRWSFMNAQGERLASIDLLPRARPVGEIRPGLLLVGIPSSDGKPRTFRSTPDLLLGKIDNWQTLVIEVPTGKILKKLEGLVPMSHPQTGKQVWLIDKNGEPFDLAFAEADPQPILPFRPKLAGI